MGGPDPISKLDQRLQWSKFFYKVIELQYRAADHFELILWMQIFSLFVNPCV